MQNAITIFHTITNFKTNTGPCVSIVIWIFTSVWLDVCQNVSCPSHFHPQWRWWCMQGQNVTRHSIDISGVCITAIGWFGGYAMGHCWPDGTPFEQFNIGNQFHRPKCCVSASGINEFKLRNKWTGMCLTFWTIVLWVRRLWKSGWCHCIKRKFIW